MKLDIAREVQKKMIEKGFKNLVFRSDYDYGEDSIDSRFLNAEELEALKQICLQKKFHKDIVNRRVVRAVNMIQDLVKGGGEKKIANLQKMEGALIILLGPLPNHWVFKEEEVSKVMVPYFISNIEYNPPTTRGGDYHPAYLKLEALAMRQGTRASISKTIYSADITGGVTTAQFLGDIGWVPETPGLVEQHTKHVDYYNECSVKTGAQFLARGQGKTFGEDHWDIETINFEKHGIPSKVVMDNKCEDNEDSRGSYRGRNKNTPIIASVMWVKKEKKNKNQEDEEESEPIRLPVHPFVDVFVLTAHQYATVHVANIQDYKYDEKLTEKLVLSDDKRELIDLLIHSEQDEYSDIVEGKGKGVIILTSGPPGTGKTLTAEVFAEKIKKPLYIVQCSQLGTDATALEKLLVKVLDRATRWGAILLIDEADVYIHERGDSMEQNAIVGVFLRLLEYYSGILFLTTNRVTIVDDAIISRVMAHVRYKLPTADEKTKLWKILANQYGVNLPFEVIDELVGDRMFEFLSGRSIKQLCRLSKALANKRKVEIDCELVEEVAEFQNIESVKDK